jgi:multicomponent Na+:H+ antiporter subunit G
MVEKIVVGVSFFFMVCGLFVFFCAAIGFLRFPDFYTRMHATGKGDTLGILLLLSGLALYNLFIDFSWLGFIQSLKIITVIAFWFLASPTATHALLKSAFDSGIKPYTKDGVVIVEKKGVNEGV